MGGKEKSGCEWWQQQGMRVEWPEAKELTIVCQPLREFKTD